MERNIVVFSSFAQQVCSYGGSLVRSRTDIRSRHRYDSSHSLVCQEDMVVLCGALGAVNERIECRGFFPAVCRRRSISKQGRGEQAESKVRHSMGLKQS